MKKWIAAASVLNSLVGVVKSSTTPPPVPVGGLAGSNGFVQPATSSTPIRPATSARRRIRAAM